MATGSQSKRVLVLSTGGTIEKSYDESSGVVENKDSLIKEWISQRLRLPYTQIEVRGVLNKDSLEMDDSDRALVLATIKAHQDFDAIVVLHGTDTMAQTMKYCHKEHPKIESPVIFTGAMKPLRFEDSDAKQNVVEALMVAKIVDPGYYVSFHGALFAAPNVRKNKEKGTFETE